MKDLFSIYKHYSDVILSEDWDVDPTQFQNHRQMKDWFREVQNQQKVFNRKKHLPKVFVYQKHYNLQHGPIEKLVHGVKERDNNSIKLASQYLASVINERGAIFVPVPNSIGSADYTLKMAKMIAKKTGGVCKDILIGNRRRETLHAQKVRNEDISLVDLGIKLKPGTVIDKSFFNHPIYLVDNVIGTGKTYLDVLKILRMYLGSDADIRMLALAATKEVGEHFNIIQTDLFQE